MIRFISWLMVGVLTTVVAGNEVYQRWYKPYIAIETAQMAAKDLKTFTLKAMELANVKASDEAKERKADKIVATTMKYVKSTDGQQSFITMIGIESAFNGATPKSSKGATGLTQLMPGLFLGFAKECGLKVNQEDINNEDINLEVGACHFNQLLVDNGTNSHLAALAYNGGQKTADNFKKKKDIPHESAMYGNAMIYFKGLALNGH